MCDLSKVLGLGLCLPWHFLQPDVATASHTLTRNVKVSAISVTILFLKKSFLSHANANAIFIHEFYIIFAHYLLQTQFVMLQTGQTMTSQTCHILYLMN